MSHEIHADYGRTFLLPPSIDEWVSSGHPARFIKEFVDNQDLELLGFKIRASDEGRPNYSSELLLKAWLYGQFLKIRSTRGLEYACHDNMGMIWLLGMARPDHNTLWRFYRDNKEAIKELLKVTIRIAAKAGLVNLVLTAVDGTKIAADVSRDKALHRERLEKLLLELPVIVDEVFNEVERNEAVEADLECLMPDELAERSKLREIIRGELAKLKNAGTSHLSPTDEEARMMKLRSGTEFGYNAQIAVDSANGVIVAADVVNEGNDNHQLTGMVEQVEQNLGKAADTTVADAGYFSGEQLAQADSAGYNVVVNIPETRKGRRDNAQWEFHKSKFAYDAANDMYTCPQGGNLTFEQIGTNGGKKRYRTRIYRCRDFEKCPFRHECSQNPKGRTIAISEFENAVAAQKLKHRSPQIKAILQKRKTIVEPIFGIIKRAMGFRRWTVRGLANVKAQWFMICTVFNLAKLYRLWAAQKLTFAA